VDRSSWLDLRGEEGYAHGIWNDPIPTHDACRRGLPHSALQHASRRTACYFHGTFGTIQGIAMAVDHARPTRVAFRGLFAMLVALGITGFAHATEPGGIAWQQIDPMIGTGGNGHTFPGATVPFGMIQLSPD